MKKRGGEHPLTVAVRVRPMNEQELLTGATQIAHSVDKQMVVLLDPTEDPDDILRANRSRERRYVFDYAFNETSDQEEVYQETTRFLIDQVLNGYNGTVFAYGATGAGKTHTMLGTQDNPGIYSRALNDLFLSVEKYHEETMHNVSMSYLEIYNEMIKDLLNPSAGYLEMREDAKGGVQVANLSEISTASTKEIMELLQKGNMERTQEPTKANKTSSRSHAVLQITVKQRSRARGIDSQIKTGRLFLVDLAGSERAANTENRGRRMVEGAHINRSLLALGNCITALSESSDKGSRTYVNYRDSKLTRLLKDALGGNCKTVMIAHLGPASFHFEESRNTLLYADRAKRIKNKVRRNVEDVTYHIAQYTQIISELKGEIERLKLKVSQSVTIPSSIQAVQNEVLRSANDHEFFKLKEQLMMNFKEQMELRRSLMELSNTTMEINIESSRHSLTITEWENEHAKRKELAGAGDKELEKKLDLEGASYDDDEEPHEVRSAREELKVLMAEKKKTEKLRLNVSKELEISRQKAAFLEENIPKYLSTDFQKEIIALLLRIHELEIQNVEYQSQCYLRENDLTQKDFIITRYQYYKSLADEIITQQRELLVEKKIAQPKELEELYDMYLHEQQYLEEGASSARRTLFPSIKGSYTNLIEIGASMLNLDRLSTLPEETSKFFSRQNDSLQWRQSSPDPPDEVSKVFSLSPKSIGLRTNNVTAPQNLAVVPLRLKSKEDTLYSISIRSNSMESIDRREPEKPKSEQLQATPKINQETRGIAALAAAKKKRQQQNEFAKIGFSDGQRNLTFVEPDTRLTTSRLAKHNSKNEVSQNTGDEIRSHPSIDQRSHNTDHIYTNSENMNSKDGKLIAAKHRSKPQLKGPQKMASSSEAHSDKIVDIPNKSVKHQKRQAIRAKQSSNSWKVVDQKPSLVKQKPSKVTSRHLKSYGNSLYNNSNISLTSLSRVIEEKENIKHKNSSQPTIPSYLKGDITVAGFGLHY